MKVLEAAPRARAWLGLALVAVACGVVLRWSPFEALLGSLLKPLYVHGALERVSVLAYFAGGLSGAAFLALKRPSLARWAQALAETAVALWIAQFLISVPSHMGAWSASSLSEPRVVTALWLLGLTVLVYLVGRWMDSTAWVAFAALANAIVVLLLLRSAANILQPLTPGMGMVAAETPVMYGLVVALVAAPALGAAYYRTLRLTPHRATSKG